MSDQTTTETNGTDLTSALQRGVCVLFSTSLLGIRRKVSPGAVTVDAERDYVHIQKTLLESEAYDAIGKRDSEMRRWLTKRTVGPAIFRDGIYLLPLALLEQVDATLNAYLNTERPALVEKFIADYETARAAAQVALKSLFDPSDYLPADAARQKFGARLQYIAFSAPEQLKSVAPDVYQRERAQLASELRATLDDCRAAIRSEFAELVTHLADRLAPGDDGKRKKLHDSAITKITEWLELFEARNTIGQDAELADLVASVRGIMRGVTPDDLKGSQRFREAVRTALSDVSERASSLIIDAPARAMFSDE